MHGKNQWRVSSMWREGLLMEDVQDGIKVSIQDGVTEDPEFIEKTDVAHKSFGGIVYIMTEISNPEIESELSTTTNGVAKTANITSTVAGVVT